ncbi:uncharacterized protein F5Z01DRAFT_643488 [Emericellopsis atlantica]|uniref:Uncharacterized protein n=1 Tax=Emericellopsis atlantica TaxID=2614577 RepID=A0A9P8CWC1_9HYPO|nr:uncharacterized protein F5Z01DRAFT_643488 [Emericellopsis atlantica]KAG9258526.1 hypothetical protein F5Z01DRAFT_643488 [Emericellopsis atlantica]
MVTEEEENCTVFEVYQSFENPGEIRLVQTWNNDIYWMKAVRAYPPPRPKPLGLSGNDRSYNFMTKCYHKTYFAATEALHSKPREFKIFNRPAMEYKYSAGAH